MWISSGFWDRLVGAVPGSTSRVVVPRSSGARRSAPPPLQSDLKRLSKLLAPSSRTITRETWKRVEPLLAVDFLGAAKRKGMDSYLYKQWHLRTYGGEGLSFLALAKQFKTDKNPLALMHKTLAGNPNAVVQGIVNRYTGESRAMPGAPWSGLSDDDWRAVAPHILSREDQRYMKLAWEALGGLAWIAVHGGRPDDIHATDVGRCRYFYERWGKRGILNSMLEEAAGPSVRSAAPDPEPMDVDPVGPRSGVQDLPAGDEPDVPGGPGHAAWTLPDMPEPATVRSSGAPRPLFEGEDLVGLPLAGEGWDALPPAGEGRDGEQPQDDDAEDHAMEGGIGWAGGDITVNTGPQEFSHGSVEVLEDRPAFDTALAHGLRAAVLRVRPDTELARRLSEEAEDRAVGTLYSWAAVTVQETDVPGEGELMDPRTPVPVTVLSVLSGALPRALHTQMTLNPEGWLSADKLTRLRQFQVACLAEGGRKLLVEEIVAVLAARDLGVEVGVLTGPGRDQLMPLADVESDLVVLLQPLPEGGFRVGLHRKPRDEREDAG